MRGSTRNKVLLRIFPPVRLVRLVQVSTRRSAAYLTRPHCSATEPPAICSVSKTTGTPRKRG